MIKKSAILALADGTVYEGISVGAEGDCVGELVFNTSMTGYQEMLSDPSYAKQIITLTASHIGNTGCNEEDMESTKVWAAGMVMKNCTSTASNYRSTRSFPEWLRKKGVVAIAGVDTREITAKLRDKGALGACISTHVDQPELALEKAKAFSGLSGVDLAVEVSRQTTERWHEGQGQWAKNPIAGTHHVVVYDFGVKHNILRILYDKGFHITIVPAQTPAKEVIAMNPDGVLLSNGPGDPQACTYAIEATKELIEKDIPVFGICLGFQILALACGGKTVKMKFGHHGSNHPVVETTGKKRVFITSQNHGFTVDETTLPDSLEVTHRSLFDNSLQGIRHKYKPAFGFQGHPEASPGPHDIDVLFDNFLKIINKEVI